MPSRSLMLRPEYLGGMLAYGESLPHARGMPRLSVMLAAVHGFCAVACGAFGAHGLRPWLERGVDGARRLQWWETAAHYQLIHAVALLGAAWVASRAPGRAASFAVGGLAIGALIFAGSLYLMTLTNVRGLGAVTPIGGTGLLLGWLALGLAARELGRAS